MRLVCKKAIPGAITKVPPTSYHLLFHRAGVPDNTKSKHRPFPDNACTLKFMIELKILIHNEQIP